MPFDTTPPTETDFERTRRMQREYFAEIAASPTHPWGNAELTKQARIDEAMKRHTERWIENAARAHAEGRLLVIRS